MTQSNECHIATVAFVGNSKAGTSVAPAFGVREPTADVELPLSY